MRSLFAVLLKLLTGQEFTPFFAALRGISGAAMQLIDRMHNPAKLILEACNAVSSLQKKCVSSNPIVTESRRGGDGCSAGMTRMQHLNLGWCGNLKDEAVLRVVPGLRHLCDLRLSRCKVGWHSAANLAAFDSCETLAAAAALATCGLLSRAGVRGRGGGISCGLKPQVKPSCMSCNSPSR